MGREILNPFEVFTDVDGDPLEDGFIFLGAAGFNAEASPVSAFWDASLSIPAAQPVRTLGGYPSQSGSPGRLFVEGDTYSILVKNKNGTLVFSATERTSGASSSQGFDSVADLRSRATNSLKYARTAGYTTAGDGGAAFYYLDAADTTTVDDGFLCIVASDGGRWKLNFPQEINVAWAGTVFDGATDNLAALQKVADTGLPLYIPSNGTVQISATVVCAAVGQYVRGDGQGKTIVEGTFVSGALFRFKGQYSKIFGMSLRGDTTRSTAAYTSNGFGVHFECDDIPDDPLVTRMRNCTAEDLEITGQTGAAIYMAGPVIDGSEINRVRMFSNQGHAIAIDRGFLSGRVNKASTVGVVTINDCLAFGNTGHALAAGHKDDTATTQTVRIVANNYDCNGSAMVLAQLYDATNAHVMWLSGSNNEVNYSVCTGDGSQRGIFMQGTNCHVRNIRQIETAATVEIGDNVAALYTDGVKIDGINVVNTVPQAAAVVLSNAPNAKNVTIYSVYESDITALVDTYTSPGLEIESSSQLRATTADQTVNNSTAVVDITGLSFYIKPNEKIIFRANLYHTGDAAADLRVTVNGPAAATTVLFSSTGAVQVAAAGTPVAADAENAFNQVISIGTNGANVRLATIEGFIENGANAGTVVMKFAQLSAVAADTTILKGSNMKIDRLRE